MHAAVAGAVTETHTQALTGTLSELAAGASIEINVADVKHLDASRALLVPGTRIYVSHLPKQQWTATQETCRAVRAAGFRPIPHIPVRLLPDEATLERLLDAAQVEEVLLISGDYPQAVGPYSSVSEVLRGKALYRHGLKRLSFAGHPEGHPQVALAEIRAAEEQKVALAQAAGLDATLLTQFFFESAPFLEWARGMQARGVTARFAAGLAGPANLSTLLRFAVRCGAGPSIRALSKRPSSLLHLMDEQGPQTVLRELAEARLAGTVEFASIHLFCFGGYLRTCRWLHAVANGNFTLESEGGFAVKG